MNQTTNLIDEFADKSVDTNIGSQKHTQRLGELQNWNEEQAHGIAKKEGVELTDAHFEVIRKLRDYYLEVGSVESGRELGDMLDETFSDQGGRKYLRRLFPQGPITQGMRFAGLPIPAHSEDAGFGTAR